VAWALAEELNRRLYGTLEQISVNAFGSVRQRVTTSAEAVVIVDAARLYAESGRTA
jgi:hypothetical protein